MSGLPGGFPALSCTYLRLSILHPGRWKTPALCLRLLLRTSRVQAVFTIHGHYYLMVVPCAASYDTHTHRLSSTAIPWTVDRAHGGHFIISRCSEARYRTDNGDATIATVSLCSLTFTGCRKWSPHDFAVWPLRRRSCDLGHGCRAIRSLVSYVRRVCVILMSHIYL